MKHKNTPKEGHQNYDVTYFEKDNPKPKVVQVEATSESHAYDVFREKHIKDPLQGEVDNIDLSAGVNTAKSSSRRTLSTIGFVARMTQGLSTTDKVALLIALGLAGVIGAAWILDLLGII